VGKHLSKRKPFLAEASILLFLPLTDSFEGPNVQKSTKRDIPRLGFQHLRALHFVSWSKATSRASFYVQLSSKSSRSRRIPHLPPGTNFRPERVAFPFYTSQKGHPPSNRVIKCPRLRSLVFHLLDLSLFNLTEETTPSELSDNGNSNIQRHDPSSGFRQQFLSQRDDEWKRRVNGSKPRERETLIARAETAQRDIERECCNKEGREWECHGLGHLRNFGERCKDSTIKLDQSQSSVLDLQRSRCLPRYLNFDPSHIHMLR